MRAAAALEKSGERRSGALARLPLCFSRQALHQMRRDLHD